MARVEPHDADLLLDDGELATLIEEANIGAALEATNRELEPLGLYLAHIWGPEQQILTPEWREGCRRLELDFGSDLLRASVLGPIDLIASKLCRADDGDLADIRFLVETQSIDRSTLEALRWRALVPADFLEVFPANLLRALESI